ncbi:hypothetical protein D3C75_1118090 [compost metagenome]
MPERFYSLPQPILDLRVVLHLAHTFVADGGIQVVFHSKKQLVEGAVLLNF